MLTRRELGKQLGISAVFAALPKATTAETLPAPSANGIRSRINLNGVWERRVQGIYYDSIEVPSSQRLFGSYQLKRTFLAPQLAAGERAILHFEAITFHGRVFINGIDLGVMGPYTAYEFETTAHLRPGANEVAVTICDLAPEPDGACKDAVELGVTPGWEAYGGIIRDLYVEIRHAVFIENVRLAYELQAPYAVAHCRATVFLSSVGATSGTLRVSLLEGEVEAAAVEQAINLPAGSSERELALELKDPVLWTPDRPNIYKLAARIQCGPASDEYSCRTGFRHTEIHGADFYLNGEKLKLHGLSWLGTWKGQGFTLTRTQMASDMRAMKEMGCNFVRLHLFPQDRYIVELADELGLLVCEEPGFWQVDFTTMRPSLIDLGLDVLARTIRRDWNSPSVFAWLLSNESTNTVEYLKKGADLCRKIDPIGRFVSCANDRKGEKAKAMFDAAGLDFYSQHPYDLDPNDFDKACADFGTSRPLIFDEWGGRAIGQSRVVLKQQCDRILELMQKDELAGEMFFSWNDLPEFSRVDLEMVEGIVQSGVVTEAREPRDDVYSQLAQLFRNRFQQQGFAGLPPVVESLRRSPWSSQHQFYPVELQGLADAAPARESWAALEERMVRAWDSNWLTRGESKRSGGKFRFWKDTPIQILGVPFRSPVVDGYVRPLVVTPEVPSVDIPIGLQCMRLHVLGQVTLPGGFPISGVQDAIVANYAVKFRDGTIQHVPLRNGAEVCTGNLMYQASRIAPGTTGSQRAVTFIRDISREHYQVLLLTIETNKTRVESLTLSLASGQLPLLLFAVTAESV